MIIYDSENGKLYVPGKKDEIILSVEEIYEQGRRDGYRDGYQDATQECEN